MAPAPDVLRLITLRDLLKRHSTSHNDRVDSKKHHSSPQVARVAQACVNCATAKLKCGNEKPCRRCEQKGIVCRFPPASKNCIRAFEKRDNCKPPNGFVHQQSPSQMLDLDGLEVAATLSTMDAQSRIFEHSMRIFQAKCQIIGAFRMKLYL